MFHTTIFKQNGSFIVKHDISSCTLLVVGTLFFLLLSSSAHNQDREITAIPPSLRNIEGEEEDKIHNELRVTPAFQKHVAKHLSKLLDRYY